MSSYITITLNWSSKYAIKMVQGNKWLDIGAIRILLFDSDVILRVQIQSKAKLNGAHLTKQTWKKQAILFVWLQKRMSKS